jgi:phosphoribosylglycinamide formyltransferase 1
MKKKRVGILISGRGSNMVALVEACHNPLYPADVVCVVSNTADAGGLAYARVRGIATTVISHKDFADRESFDGAINQYLQSHRLDLVCCAGFMRIMTPVLIQPWEGRMLNIHPSLLPAYRGLHTHERAINDATKLGGCTVHFVTEELDGGPIIAQASVPIMPGDTAELLQARVLASEHGLYVKALELVASGRIQMRTSN